VNTQIPEEKPFMSKALLKRIAGYVAVLLLAVGFAYALTLNQPYVTGDRLTFSFPDLNGELVDQDHPDLQGKVLMVNLWGTWCPPCRAEMPHLIRLKKMYGERGFEIVAIEFPALSTKTDEERRVALSKFAEEVGINYRILLGVSAGSVQDELPGLRNAGGFPTNVFIGRDGTVDVIHTGFYEGDVPTYEAIIERLLGAATDDSE
jgi:thiol-disulfide isomerase/thioredoxin